MTWYLLRRDEYKLQAPADTASSAYAQVGAGSKLLHVVGIASFACAGALDSCDNSLNPAAVIGGAITNLPDSLHTCQHFPAYDPAGILGRC